MNQTYMVIIMTSLHQVSTYNKNNLIIQDVGGKNTLSVKTQGDDPRDYLTPHSHIIPHTLGNYSYLHKLINL